MCGGGGLALNTTSHISVSKDADVLHIQSKLREGAFKLLRAYPNLKPPVACLWAGSPNHLHTWVWSLGPRGTPRAHDTGRVGEALAHGRLRRALDVELQAWARPGRVHPGTPSPGWAGSSEQPLLLVQSTTCPRGVLTVVSRPPGASPGQRAPHTGAYCGQSMFLPSQIPPGLPACHPRPAHGEGSALQPLPPGALRRGCADHSVRL